MSHHHIISLLCSSPFAKKLWLCTIWRSVFGNQNFQRHFQWLAELAHAGKTTINADFQVANRVNVGTTVTEPRTINGIADLWQLPDRYSMFSVATCGDIGRENEKEMAAKMPKTRMWRRYGDQSPLNEALHEALCSSADTAGDCRGQDFHTCRLQFVRQIALWRWRRPHR